MAENPNPVRATGRCLCGSVRFAVHGPLRSTVTACHCSSCRRFTGGLWTGTMAKVEDVFFDNLDTLKWYRSSAEAERGFCGRCGSGLFWHELGGHYYSIAAGSIDEPTGLKLACHGWTSEAADYWDFSPDVPQRSGPSGLGLPQDAP